MATSTHPPLDLGAHGPAVAWLRSVVDGLAVPLPGSGRTLERWRWLAGVARQDLSRARLVEGHLDALAILTELGCGERTGRGPWGVWAAEPALLAAHPTAEGGWHLRGRKGWCSGSLGLDHALVTAVTPDGPQLFALDLADVGDGVTAVAGSWQPLGMVNTASHTLCFDVVLPAAATVGPPGAYVHRPGFGHGGAGVAACWFGGALAVADDVAAAAGRAAEGEPGARAAWGRVRARLHAGAGLLERSARAVDAAPGSTALADEVALLTRLGVEDVAVAVLGEAQRACGAGALAHDHAHARRVADLQLYLRQLHPFPDAARAGGDVAPFRW